MTGLLLLKNSKSSCAISSFLFPKHRAGQNSQQGNTETSAKEKTTAIRKSTPWPPPGSSPGSAGTQSAVPALFCLFGMDTVQEGLLNGEAEQGCARPCACR